MDARQIIFKKQSLIDERTILSRIVHESNNVGDIKELLSDNAHIDGAEDALTAYEEDEIGHEYFDFIEYCKNRIGEITNELNLLPRVSLSEFMSLKHKYAS